MLVGASVAILDFNNSTDPNIDSVQAWFLENLVVPAARQYGLEAEYEYLRPSIKMFPTGEGLHWGIEVLVSWHLNQALTNHCTILLCLPAPVRA